LTTKSLYKLAYAVDPAASHTNCTRGILPTASGLASPCFVTPAPTYNARSGGDTDGKTGLQGGPGPSARSSCACRRVAWRCRAPRLILLQPYALDDLAVLHSVGRRDVELGHRLPENEAGHVLLLHHPGADVDAREYF